MDVFLFNDSRSIMGEEVNMFRILEDLKDGAATTSKYDNQVLKFKTPNIVMVFSNSRPNEASLSQDRWDIYSPSANGLKRTSKRDEGRAILNRRDERMNALPPAAKERVEQRQIDILNGDIVERNEFGPLAV